MTPLPLRPPPPPLRAPPPPPPDLGTALPLKYAFEDLEGDGDAGDAAGDAAGDRELPVRAERGPDGEAAAAVAGRTAWKGRAAYLVSQSCERKGKGKGKGKSKAQDERMNETKIAGGQPGPGGDGKGRWRGEGR